MGRYIWIAVEADKYELPIAIADTARELGEMIGVDTKTVMSSEYRKNSGRDKGIRYRKVRSDD